LGGRHLTPCHTVRADLRRHPGRTAATCVAASADPRADRRVALVRGAGRGGHARARGV